jgi:menaquinone-9 beta-reductase
MRDPVEAGVFFAGDSAGHCFPTTAEGIRTAFMFGLACGRELRAVLEGRQTREQALERYAALCEERRYAFRWLLRVQRLVGRINRGPAMDTALRLMDRQAFVDWAFGHYLELAPPSFVASGRDGRAGAGIPAPAGAGRAQDDAAEPAVDRAVA